RRRLPAPRLRRRNQNLALNTSTVSRSLAACTITPRVPHLSRSLQKLGTTTISAAPSGSYTLFRHLKFLEKNHPGDPLCDLDFPQRTLRLKAFASLPQKEICLQ